MGQSPTNLKYGGDEPKVGMDQPGKARVVVNYSTEEASAEVSWPGGDGQTMEILQPFQADAMGTRPATLRLAPRRCAVVVKI
jgi:hypothetical protein